MACCAACEGPTTIGGVDGGECDAPVKITWPSDVDALKARLRVHAETFDVGVRACSSLSAEDRRAWDLFIADFRAWSGKPTGLFGTYGEWVTGCSYAHTLDAWRDKLTRECGSVPGPDKIKGADTSLVKWIAGAVIVGGVALVVATQWPAISAAMKR